MTENILVEAENTSLPTAIQSMINRSCIVDFGVIQEVVAKGLVFVAVSVANSKKDIRYMTCTLVNIAGEDFTLNVTPKQGDKVLVLYPRRYSSKMFRKEKTDVYIDEKADGYNLMCGLAILCNQYRTDTHKNIITFENGGFTFNLVYDKDNDNNKVVMSVNTDGEMSYTSNDNFSFNIVKDGTFNLKALKDDKFSLSLSSDGAVAVKQNNTNINVNKDDEITVNNGKAVIKVDKNGNVSIDAQSGKITLKNSSANLFTILDGMLQTLNSSLMTAGSPASHTVVPQQFAKQSIDLGNLMQ